MKCRFATQAAGLSGVLSGLLVAYKQAIPEHRLGPLRVKQLPFWYFVLLLALFLARVLHVAVYMAANGMAVAWVYLRFFCTRDGRGDRSETFSFASFFPDWMT
jgi:membrane associated rhomboid family serine protease